MLITYSHPKGFPRCREVSLAINGQAVEVLKCDAGNFTVCALTGGLAEVVITAHARMKKSCSIHPRRLGVEGRIESNQTLHFILPRAENVMVKSPGFDDLYLFIHDAAEVVPTGDCVLRIPAGQTVEAASLDLDGYDRLHIEGGGVLKGRIVARNRPGLHISGHGIFDGAFYQREHDGVIPSVVLERCPGCLIEDITMVNPAGWMILLGASDGARIRRVRQLGSVISSDGVDIVGSSNVLVENCFISNNDDCVVVKAFHVGKNNLDNTQVDGLRNVENVMVRNCVLVNGPSGNAMEIGHELSCDHVRNIRFENIDVVNVHGHGAVFSIHNAGRAMVEIVVYDTIRIEHCFDMLIDFRIVRSRWCADEERGRIRDVALRNVDWSLTPFNEGSTHSLVCGWDNDHRIENISVADFRMDGNLVANVDALEIGLRHADPVTIATT